MVVKVVVRVAVMGVLVKGNESGWSRGLSVHLCSYYPLFSSSLFALFPHFLDASAHLYKRVCLSVRPYVRPYVR